MHKSTIKKIIGILAAITVVMVIGILIKENNNKDNNDNNNVSEQPSTAKPVIKDFAALKDVTDKCSITKYFTYGTSFCLEGSVTNSQITGIEDMSLILRQAYTEPDGSIVSDDLYEFDVFYTLSSDNIFFSSYESINKGIYLDNINEGEYCMLLKITFNDSSYKYLTLNDNTSENDICYYTMTKNNTNKKIDIAFNEFNSQEYMSFNVTPSSLPEDVYDIVIDPGHGGTDSGSVNGTYYEADIVLDYSLDLKEALEAEGFKVKLTRDGSEDKDTPMAYTMYDTDGRVNVAGASSAKYCLSLHLNSNAEYVAKGGVQVYVSCRADAAFAKILADNIVSSSGTILSTMNAFKISDGVYTRAFSQSDVNESISEARAGGYEPYNVTTDTDYYYMIRELGGIATNAYVDGRKSTYGANLYKNSNIGIESYIIELGFISIDEDLNHILNNKESYIKGIVNSFTSM